MSSCACFSFVFRQKVVWIFLLTLSAYSQTPDVWNAPAFSANPQALLAAAASVKADKNSAATVLLEEARYTFDKDGKIDTTFHSIYRIENEEGVNGWAETSSQWEPWHQAKPEIRARVITADAAVHNLDPKTLSDMPVHENSSETYTDQRAFGGPLPAIAVGAIVEELIVVRDTAPFFAGGMVERLQLNKSVPVNKTRVVVSHPDSLPLRYSLKQMPAAQTTKVSRDGFETIAIEDGPYPPRTEKLTHLPSDVPRGPEIEFSTGTSWSRVAAEYARLSNEKLRAADVQLLMSKLNVKPGTRQEFIRRIVAALHNNVRYTGVEFGESSLVPQFPAETLKRKYGDCKDKAALLVTMLRAVNIPASLALLSTGPSEDVNPELPGMGMFDHAIVYLPASESDPEMWIDATAQYMRVGDLPQMDYGRWALVVDENSNALVKIPELTADRNFHRELREFTLAEFGPATIRETDEQMGPREADFRSFYNGDAKEVREGSEKYVKRTYLADSLTALEHGNLSDLEKPFSITFVSKGKRGNTDYENAVVAIRVEDLMDDFPDYFTTSPEDEKNEQSAQGHEPRLADWQIDPFINEWEYKIVAPAGFKLRALPPNKDEQLGLAKFTQKYSANADGTVVDAVLRFESTKTRFSNKEADLLRDAVVKARSTDPIFITFDQIGHSLIAAGKIKEGLAAYQQLTEQHPKEALHRIQLSKALLAVGLGEKARVLAQQATQLEPNSAQAYSNLGWVLEHDLLGRRLTKGFDYNGAIIAYRKARDFDPKDTDIRINLGSLLEYDSNAVRYSPNGRLKEAIAEFKELKKINEETGRRHEDFILYDLWYSHEFSALAQDLESVPATDTRRGFVVALAAINSGTDAALKKALEITTSEELRKKALTNAGWFLLRLHKYSEASDLLAAGARGEQTETQTALFAASLKKTKPRTEIKLDDATPAGVIQHLFSSLFTTHPDFQQMLALMSRDALQSAENTDVKDFLSSTYQLRRTTEKNGVPFETVGDIVLSNARYSSEGNDALGYRVTMEIAGAAPQNAFVVREGAAYKLLDFGGNTGKPPENLGLQALALLKKGDLTGARKWLDWAREQIHMSASDDPLSGQPFPYFWTKGQEGDVEAIRTAALVLTPSKELKGDDLNFLIQAREKATSEQKKARLDLVVAWAYSKQKRWVELAPVAARLLQAFPESTTALHMMTLVYAQIHQYEDWDSLVKERMSKYPDELDYVRSAAELARYRGDFAGARELIKNLIDHSKASASDLNLYAWDALFLSGEIERDSIDAAERANQMTQNSNFNYMHTLACLYAHIGKAAQARALLLKAMEGNLEEPNSAVWLAYGQIAEAYGEPDAARSMYARVEKSDTESPTSGYTLAQQRLVALKAFPVPSTKSSASR